MRRSASARLGLVVWISPQAQAVASASLCSYDVARGSAKPSLDLSAAVGGASVLQAAFTPTSNAPVTNFTAWEALPAKPGPLSFLVRPPMQCSAGCQMGGNCKLSCRMEGRTRGCTCCAALLDVRFLP